MVIASYFLTCFQRLKLTVQTPIWNTTIYLQKLDTIYWSIECLIAIELTFSNAEMIFRMKGKTILGRIGVAVLGC